MLKLLIFDCDGVMFDSRDANRRYYDNLLHHFGYPPMDKQELEFAHMHSADNAVRHIFRNYQTPWETIKAYRKEKPYATFLKYIEIEKDLVEFLSKAKGRYKMAISTNRGDTMYTLLQRHNIEHFFDKIITSGDVQALKPDPEGLQKILTCCSCYPKDALFIGDSILDRQQSASCNVPLAAFKNADLAAEFHINTFMELFTLPPFQD